MRSTLLLLRLETFHFVKNNKKNKIKKEIVCTVCTIGVAMQGVKKLYLNIIYYYDCHSRLRVRF